MEIYKIIKQISINDKTKERKERYVVVKTYSTLVERIVFNGFFGGFIWYDFDNVFGTIEEAREYKEKLENQVTYTYKDEIIE